MVPQKLSPTADFKSRRWSCFPSEGRLTERPRIIWRFSAEHWEEEKKTWRSSLEVGSWKQPLLPKTKQRHQSSWQRVGIRAIYLGVMEHTSDPSSMLGGRGRKIMNLRPTELYKKNPVERRKRGREVKVQKQGEKGWEKGERKEGEENKRYKDLGYRTLFRFKVLASVGQWYSRDSQNVTGCCCCPWLPPSGWR